jgi:hypothetical protein
VETRATIYGTLREKLYGFHSELDKVVSTEYHVISDHAIPSDGGKWSFTVAAVSLESGIVRPPVCGLEQLLPGLGLTYQGLELA